MKNIEKENFVKDFNEFLNENEGGTDYKKVKVDKGFPKIFSIFTKFKHSEKHVRMPYKFYVETKKDLKKLKDKYNIGGEYNGELITNIDITEYKGEEG